MLVGQEVKKEIDDFLKKIVPVGDKNKSSLIIADVPCRCNPNPSLCYAPSEV